MDRKKNRQGKLPMWQERLRRNSAAMREEFEQMDKRTALYNGTREIEKTPDAKSSKAAAQASGRSEEHTSELQSLSASRMPSSA